MKLLSLFILAAFALVQAVSADDLRHHRVLQNGTTIAVIEDTEEDAEGDVTTDTIIDEEVTVEEDIYLGCDQVESGDVFIYHVQSMDSDEAVSFMALEDLPGNLHLYITDFPWNGETFLNSTDQVGDEASGDSGEGVLMFITPEEGIKAGEKFEYSGDTEEDWFKVEGSYDLAITGDSVFLYCLLGDETYNNLVGLSFDWKWADPGLSVEEYSTDQTAQPEDLATIGSVILEGYSGYEYIGEGLDNYTVSQKAEMQQNMIVKANWDGDGYQHDGVGTRELFTTTILALGGFVMMAL